MESSPSEDSTEDVCDGDDAVTELHATDEEFQMVGDHRVPSLLSRQDGPPVPLRQRPDSSPTSRAYSPSVIIPHAQETRTGPSTQANFPGSCRVSRAKVPPERADCVI